MTFLGDLEIISGIQIDFIVYFSSLPNQVVVSQSHLDWSVGIKKEALFDHKLFKALLLVVSQSQLEDVIRSY